MTVSEAALLSGLSKSYISQVKSGKCKPSQKLLDTLRREVAPQRPTTDYLKLFLKSREAMGVSPRTLEFYQERLSKFVVYVDYIKAKRKDVEKYLNSIPPNQYGLGNRHCSFKAMKTFYRWLNAQYGIQNPMEGMSAPILGKPVLPSLSQEQVLTLIETAQEVRDKAIIALFTESGLRLTELTDIYASDIDRENRIIRVVGKGRKTAWATYGPLTEQYLTEWLNQYQPNGGNIWGLNRWGISTLFRRLEAETGMKCNPHVFRRTFASLLRKAGVDTMTIKDLGRWESLEMVQRYTRSVTFHDSLKLYKAPLS